MGWIALVAIWVGRVGHIRDDTWLRVAYVSKAGELLLKWHRGEITLSELRPIRVVAANRMGGVQYADAADWHTGHPSSAGDVQLS